MRNLFIAIFFIVLLINANAQYKLEEDFSSATFPPSGWTRGSSLDNSGNPVWTKSNFSGYGTGNGSAFCYFLNWSSGKDSIVSPSFTAANNDTLYFDHTYRTSINEVDSLNIYTSSNNGASWTLLVRLQGGTVVGTGMVTLPPAFANYNNPFASDWKSKKYPVPNGTNKVKFETVTAHGNNLFLDNIKVGKVTNYNVAPYSIPVSGTAYTVSTSINPIGEVVNYGVAAATFTVTRKISPGGYVSTKTVTNLGAGATTFVTFDTWNYSVNTPYEIRDSVYLINDYDPNDDVLVRYLTYVNPKDILVLTYENRSRDSILSHLNLSGLTSKYDYLSTYPGISLGNWRTLIVAFASGSSWSSSLRDSLKAYLDGANNPSAKRSLLIFGNDLGYDYDPRSNPSALIADTVFYRKYLRAQFWEDDWTSLFPGAGGLIKGTTSPFSTITGQSVIDPFPDCIRPATWNTGTGTLIPAFIPTTESGNGDSCTAIAYIGDYYNVFYGTNAYYNYNPTNSGLLSPQGTFFNTIKNFIETNGGVLPVELSSFSSSVNKGNVLLSWSTASEQNNSHFTIERKPAGSNNWIEAGRVNGAGSSNQILRYSFPDNNLNTGKYSYRLKQTDYNGNFKYFNLSNEVEIGVPEKFDISQNYPNPFNPNTVIGYQLPENSFVTLKIFDISGREISRIVNEYKQAGYYSASFNASAMASGVYFYTISANGGNRSFVKTMKMALVK
ncbi:MAG: T9SS type A sorting domain-containing protein [Bacteroidetes bacterium]|nr:T9SS type A sorting domain-containing protein [Bacteroidota bacterium]